MVMYARLKALLGAAVGAGVVAALLCSCDIFTPRASKPPVGNDTGDPLNFSELVANTSYQFATLQFSNLFEISDTTYFDNNSGYSPQSTLISRLDQITTNTDVQVNWTGILLIVNIPDSLVTVTVGKYQVILDPATNKAASDSGTATFTLINNAGWHISNWKDYPAGKSASFFSPNYTQ